MRRTLLLLLLAAVIGCERPAETRDPSPPPAATADRAAPEADLRVVMLGDSLTAGYGLAKEQAFPSLVEADLRGRGWSVAVINGGVSGDTTAGGKSRLGWLLAQRPHVVVVGLGANDGLRGLPVEELAANLRSIVLASREAGALVLLAGMRVPPNYGDEYAGSFSAVYPALAAELEVALMPFLLEGVGGREGLNQADGIHPNAAGQKIIATTLVPFLEDLLRQVSREEAG